MHREKSNRQTHPHTFPANEPTQVIDWILIPREWKFADYESIPTELSDHRPVLAEIGFLEQEEQDPESIDE